MANQKILLADDSLTIQKVINLTFADEGIDVVTFNNGDDAYASLSAERPDIVLADVNMPGMNGYQMCEAIKGNIETASLPVILLVGSFEPFDEAEAGRVGANSFLTKPFHSIRQLVDLVHSLLETSAAEPVEQPPVYAAPEAEGDDIDQLYQQSFSSEDTLPDLMETTADGLSDVGMDDEMIETSYSGVPDEPVDLGADMATIPQDSYSEPAETYQIETTGQTAETFEEPAASAAEDTASENYSGGGYGDFEILPQTREPEEAEASEEEDVYTIPDADADAAETWQPPQEGTGFEFAAAEESSPAAEETPHTADEASYGFEVIENTGADEEAVDREAETAELPAIEAGFQTVNVEISDEEYKAFEEGAYDTQPPQVSYEPEEPPVKQYQESDLLELPPIEASQAEGRNVVTELSPELIDVIVEKVLERLAQR